MSAPSPALLRLLRALLLAADGPLTVGEIVALLHGAADDEEWPDRPDAPAIEAALAALARSWDGRDGVEVVAYGTGWRLRTPPDLGHLVRRLWPDRVARLSPAALETLAIIAYRQPCTRLDVEEVRGVDCGGVVRSLLDRHLVRIVGRQDEPGRPLLYATTPEFLETFSLPDLRAMPTLRDLAQMREEQAARELRSAAPDERMTVDRAARGVAAAPSDQDLGLPEIEGPELASLPILRASKDPGGEVVEVTSELDPSPPPRDDDLTEADMELLRVLEEADEEVEDDEDE